MKHTHNAYGQLDEHPDYYVDPWPAHIQEMLAGNELLDACYAAYEDHCASYSAYGFDPEYDSLPDFDDFKDGWFFDKAAQMAESEFEGDLSLDGEYWYDFTKALARDLREDDSITARGFMPYFNGWYRHGAFNRAA